MMTVDKGLSPLTQWVHERWPDMHAEQVDEIEQAWSTAQPESSPLPGWIQRGLSPDAGEPERQAVAEYADEVTGRARAAGLVWEDIPPIEQIPATAAALALLEERGIITGPENSNLPPRCAVCHGPTVEESGWLCSPCYMDQQSAISEATSEGQPAVAEAAQAIENEPQQVPEKTSKRKKQAEAVEALAVPAVVEPVQAEAAMEEAVASQAAEQPEPTPAIIEEVEVAPAISSTVPDFTYTEATYTALSTDIANLLRVEMVLHMDRLPHRWQAIYSTVDTSPLTLEQYRISKLIHQNLESDLSKLMADAAWTQTPTGGWVAPWESE